MILCAGLGTRLRPLTELVPKPLLPIGDRPLVCHIVERLCAAGFERIVVNTHYRAPAFDELVRRFAPRLTLSYEPELLGTAGGIAGARRWFGGGPVLVWNGDVLVEPPFDALRDAAARRPVVLVARATPANGSLGLDRDGRVVRLRGRSFGPVASEADYVGVACLDAEAVAGLPERGCLVGDWLMSELGRNRRPAVVPHSGDWIDIGSVGGYWLANQRFLRARGVEAWVGEGASIDSGVALEASLVGAGARVSGEGRLSQCVVWPGARAVAPLSRSIVTQSGCVALGAAADAPV
jgi:mannose-1-phosphate guanylyltransferase